MTDAHEPDPRDDDPVDRPPPGRRGLPAGRTFVVMMVTLLVWGLLYAPELKRSAETHPVGTRRTVALAILTPLAWLSDTIGLSTVTDAAARAAGRDPGGQVGGDDDSDVEPLPPAPSHTRSPRPPPTEDTDIREPTTDKKLRVVVVGDSLAQGIGYFAERVFKTYFVNVIRQGRISTGLARPDYFNWQAEMQTIADRFRPDLTIVLVGENDNQALLYPNGDLEEPIGQPGWPLGYEARVERLARTATANGGHVMWVGLPIVRDTDRWEFLKRLNEIYESVADRLPNVSYVDTWDLFAKADGGYTAYYRDGSGRVRIVRADDGIHFNSDGYTILMRQIAKAAHREFKLHPKTF
jgi:uncharacterized protein